VISIRLFHSPAHDGFGGSDVPPPPPYWLTEGLTSYSGGEVAGEQPDPMSATWQGGHDQVSQQGWSTEQDPNAWDESGQQEPTRQQAPPEDRVEWSNEAVKRPAVDDWSAQQVPESQDVSGWQTGPSSGSFAKPGFETHDQGGGFAIPPAAPSYGQQSYGMDAFPTQGEGVPAFGNFAQSQDFQSGPSAPPPPIATPPPPMEPTPAISHKAEAFSAPSFSQPSVASLRNKALQPSDPDGILLSPVTDPDPMQRGFDPPPPPPPMPGLSGFNTSEDPQPPPASPAPSFNQTPLYQGSLGGGAQAGQAASAISRDGTPRFVPDIPETIEDDGELGCRVAAGAYAVFGVMLTLGAVQSGNIGGAACVLAPVFGCAGLLLTGKRWAAILTLVLGCLWGLLFVSLALFTQAIISLITEQGITFPPLLGLGLLVVGLSFIIGNVMMLVGGPGMGRAIAGALFMLVPFVGLGIVAANSEFPRALSKPVGVFAEETIGTEEDGFTLRKPDGWNSYDWEMVKLVSPLAQGLLTVPKYHFINRKQDMMVSIYIAEPPRRSLSQLFGPGELSELEKEITRELPPKAEKPDEYPFAGEEFSEMTYEGTLQSGNALSIIVSQAKVSEKVLFVIVLTRNTKSKTTGEQATAAFNAFFKELKFAGIPVETPPTEKK